jgi:hypothetical protein
MRSLLVIALLMAGCATSKAPLPVQPDAPTKESVVTTLGKGLDKTDHRVASALVAIEHNADKPKVVVAESRLAQSYLPLPPEADVAFAMARATKADPIDYKKQMEFGRKLATAVSVAWERLEADQAEALRVSQLKDARIVELTKAVDQAKKDAAANMWTLAGIAVAVLGAAAMVFTGPRIGGTLLASGAAIGAFPFIVDSEYFTYIAGGTLALAAGLGIYWLWDRVRDSANAPYEPPQK